MKYFKTFFTFLLLSQQTLGQNVESQVKNFITTKQLTTYISYSQTCSGGIRFDSCNEQEPIYLIWKDKDSFYSIKFEQCKINEKKLIDSNNPLVFSLKYIDIIEQEEIYAPTYIVKGKSKNNKTKSEKQSIVISHSCYREVQIVKNDRKIEKQIDMFNFDLKFVEKNKPNIYYSKNKKSKLNELIKNFDEKIKNKVY